MKKFACVLALVLLCVVLAGCGEGKNPNGEDQTMTDRELRELPEDVTYDYDTSDYTVMYTDESGKFISLFGEVYSPIGEKGEKFPLVILGHGFNGHYTDFPNECARLAERGYIAYTIDFVGAQTNGKSKGRTSLEVTPFTMVEDIAAAVDELSKWTEVDETQIFLFGGSQGGFVSAVAAARLKEKVAGLVLYFPALNIPDDWRKTFPTEESIPETHEPYNWGLTLGREYFLSMHDYDPYEEIGAFEKDVLILWGTSDTIVREEYVNRAVETYAHAELVKLTGEGHGFTPAGTAKAISAFMPFLESHTYKPI